MSQSASRVGGLLAAVALCAWFTTTLRADDWTQFRGPNASGVSSENLPLPTKFSIKENVVWSVKLGKGIACPIIANGRAFTTALEGKDTFAIYAYKEETGKQLWRTTYKTGKLPDITSPNQHASCTPCTDGDRVYVHFSTLGLLCLDARSGKKLWRKKLPLPAYLLGWGAANSPIIYEDKVIFNLDDDLSPYMIALDRYTGKVKWRRPRPEMLGGYAVPVLCKANGRTDVVVAGSGKMKGYDPNTGKPLWSCNSLLRTIMTSPVVVKDRIYMSCQSYGDTNRVLKFALLQWRDTDQDGKLSKAEVGPDFADKFDKGDKNKDGLLVDDEIDAAFQSPNNMVGGGNIIQEIKGGGKGDVTKTHLLWNVTNRSPSNIASPLVVDGRMFMVKKGGISACFDVNKKGKKIWSRKRIRNLGNYYASPIAGDGKIFVTGENGYIVVLKQGSKLKVLAKNDIGESCTATPAIANGRIYVRSLNHLYCFGLKK